MLSDCSSLTRSALSSDYLTPQPLGLCALINHGAKRQRHPAANQGQPSGSWLIVGNSA